ncbi:MAG: FHA domain-containing protein [Myxococcota bacterium]
MFTLTIQDQSGQTLTRVSFEQGSYTLGRLETCDLVLPSSSVSRTHARIFVHNRRCYVEDLGSANGVTVDGQRVVGKRDLGSASQLQIGEYILLVEYRQPGAPEGQQVQPTMYIPREGDHFKLVRIHDAFTGEEFVLSEVENSIGRTDENFILLSDSSISRNHAKIIRQGNTYTVFDLNSSNGSFVNGKRLSTPLMLKPMDRAMFGSVSFLFVPCDARINLSEWRFPPNPATKVLRIAGVAALALACVLVGVFALSTITRSKQPAQDVEPAVEASKQSSASERVATLQGEAEAALAQHDWDTALAKARALKELAPDHASAERIRERAKLELKAEETLERAEVLSAEGEYERSLDLLDQLPRKTRAYWRSRDTLDYVERTLAHRYRNEGKLLERALSIEKMLPAHGLYVKAMELDPDDEDTLERLRRLEERMRQVDVRFVRYDLPE